jgi:hypothetical protein
MNNGMTMPGRKARKGACSEGFSRRWLKMLPNPATVPLSGHDPVSQGYDKAESRQLVLSASFRVQDVNKHYLEVNLACTYDDVRQLRPGFELLRLYP